MALMEIETLKKAGTCDIISNLPQEVIDTILVHLPIREAVRTSILSSEWRDKWLTISQLRFDESITSSVARKKKLISIVYAILLRHRGPICRFELSNHYSPTCFDLDQWIILLAKNGKIQELSLDFETGHEGFYIVHSLLFSCQQLTYLKLSNCLITPTPIFKGFNSLTSLHLDQVTIDDNILESLILNSPLLERITLSSIICYSFLKISGPNLKHLELQGNFKDICLENNPHLATVSIELFAETKLHARHELRRTCNLVRVLSCIPSVERLSLSGDFLKFLAISNVPDSLPIRYNHLKVLELYVLNFNNLDEISVAVSIMRSAPQLEELSIWVSYCLCNCWVHIIF
ncbi:hypothetical protein HHK36_007059 [Tetracentron sinense]|uniref:F-box domain-containing protein n=1 Tax=Tetracentron sinense TaxID=13715 RepID=A0A834ZJ43_TETSI|nr:hypothetical protein HHK36_007059 [Tetracentron sinense]